MILTLSNAYRLFGNVSSSVRSYKRERLSHTVFQISFSPVRNDLICAKKRPPTGVDIFHILCMKNRPIYMIWLIKMCDVKKGVFGKQARAEDFKRGRDFECCVQRNEARRAKISQ